MILPIYLFIHLPIELTNLILEFSGYHKLRNGRYMNQIAEAQRLAKAFMMKLEKSKSQK